MALLTQYINQTLIPYYHNKIEDFFIWGQNKNLDYEPINYDYKNRLRRQDIEKKFHENGSLYMFKPSILEKINNRLGGIIKIYEMEKHKNVSNR